MKLLAYITCIFITTKVTAQISPPGLGETHSAYWSAAGVSQKLDGKNTSLTYIGSGRISGPDGENPVDKPSIFVLNEEIYHSLNRHWQYSYALSYRRQLHYSYDENTVQNAEVHQEYRVYGRLANSLAFGNFKWKNTLRQEVRKFFNPEFGEIENGLQLRTRLKTQLNAAIGNDRSNSITASAEALFSVPYDTASGWGDYEYTESRFCLYYTLKPKDLPVVFDLGYMNDLIGTGHELTDASYLAFDIIIENPF
jgi:hypothetical protein